MSSCIIHTVIVLHMKVMICMSMPVTIYLNHFKCNQTTGKLEKKHNMNSIAETFCNIHCSVSYVLALETSFTMMKISQKLKHKAMEPSAFSLIRILTSDSKYHLICKEVGTRYHITNLPKQKSMEVKIRDT